MSAVVRFHKYKQRKSLKMSNASHFTLDFNLSVLMCGYFRLLIFLFVSTMVMMSIKGLSKSKLYSYQFILIIIIIIDTILLDNTVTQLTDK